MLLHCASFKERASNSSERKHFAGRQTPLAERCCGPVSSFFFFKENICSSSFPPLQINKLVEYYQQLAQKEKIERDRKKLVRRRNYMPLAFSVSWDSGALNIERTGPLQQLLQHALVWKIWWPVVSSVPSPSI